MKQWGLSAGVGFLLLGLIQCSNLGQCEQEAYGEGLRTTVYNPDGIGTPWIGMFHNYGDVCRVFATGTFMPVEGVDGLYRYTHPSELHVLKGGWYCHDGTLVRLSEDTRWPYEQETRTQLQACKALRTARQ